MYSRLTRPVLDRRVNETKWVVLRYPNPSMAQLAGSSLERFEDFYFDVCTLDYGKMSKAMDSLVTLMEKTDKVEIKGPGTDLTFFHKGHTGHQVRRKVQYSRRRSLHSSRERIDERHHFIQHAV